jgi:hypothetical protein
MLAIAQVSLDASSIHALVCDFKKKLKSQFRLQTFTGEHGIQTFPYTPQELPDARYQKAYASEAPTEHWKTHSLNLAGKIVPLRSTASSLRMAPSSSANSNTLDVQSIVSQVAQGFMQMLPQQSGVTNITYLRSNSNKGLPTATSTPAIRDLQHSPLPIADLDRQDAGKITPTEPTAPVPTPAAVHHPPLPSPLNKPRHL